jgi:hypothetical protein
MAFRRNFGCFGSKTLREFGPKVRQAQTKIDRFRVKCSVIDRVTGARG